MPARPIAAAAGLAGVAAVVSLVCGAETLGWILAVVCVVALAVWLLASRGASRRG